MLNGFSGGFCVFVLGVLLCSGLSAQAPPPAPPGGSGLREAPHGNGPFAEKDEFPPPGSGAEGGPEDRRGKNPGPEAAPRPGKNLENEGRFDKAPHFFKKPAIVFHIVTKVFEAETPFTEDPLNEAPSSGVEPPENKAEDGLVDTAKSTPEGENNEVWERVIAKIVLPGQPVTIKLAGKNIAVVVQFTPYPKRRLLVAQQQSWFQEADGNLRYETTIQTIPLKFNKDIYYLPLGEKKKGTEYFMEIVLNLTPYND